MSSIVINRYPSIPGQQCIEKAYDTVRGDDDDHCPSLAQHRATFPRQILSRWSHEYVIDPTGSRATLIDWPYQGYKQFSLFHRDFRIQRDALRAHEILVVKYLFIGSSTSIKFAAIRYDLRCPYCRMMGNVLSLYDGKKPCCDPFIEAREGRQDFKFPGVVGFLGARSGKIIMREDWSWRNLRGERDVIAVYSKRARAHGLLKRAWIRFKMPFVDGRECGFRGVTYIEDLVTPSKEEESSESSCSISEKSILS